MHPPGSNPGPLGASVSRYRKETDTEYHLVGWKSTEKLRHRLQRKAGKEMTRHALLKNIYVLRRRLKKAGLSKYYVQSNRRKGYRFCKKRKK